MSSVRFTWRSLTVALGLCLLPDPDCAGQAAPPRTRLFSAALPRVRDGASKILEHDLSSGRVVREVALPLPDSAGAEVSVNRVGQFAVRLPPAAGRAQLWLWDGRDAHVVSHPQPRELASLPIEVVSPEQAVQGFLSEDGTHLYWSVDDVRITGHVIRRQHHALEIVRTVDVIRTDIAGGAAIRIARLPSPPCACETYGCESSCAEVRLFAPARGIGSWFFLTSWIQSPVASRVLSTDAWVRGTSGWERCPLPTPVFGFLDASGPATRVDAWGDAGCNGQANESRSRTVLVRSGEKTVLFDEVSRFANKKYDVSFQSQNAELSPDGERVAHTLGEYHEYGDRTIRLCDPGGAHADAVELARIHAAQAELPVVEVVSVAGTVERHLPHRRLVGWRDPARLVLLDGQSVVVFDVRSGREYATGIRVADERRVWLR